MLGLKYPFVKLVQFQFSKSHFQSISGFAPQRHNSSMDRISVALIDLSGTLHIEDLATDGASSALQKLRNIGIKVKFVTNTTKEPLRLLHDRLCRLGFKIHKDDIFTSLTAAKALVANRQLRPLLMLEDCAKEDFDGISQENPNAVVVGLAPSCFNYSQMNDAFCLLLTGVPLIAIHKGRYFKKKDGLCLGPGGFVSALEYATDSTAEVVGKPEKIFFLEAIKEMEVEPSECVMIGDDVRDDIAGALKVGMLGILVKTGKYRNNDENTIDPPPTAVCANFAEAVDTICGHIIVSQNTNN